jgi:hypothetical protein
MYSHVGRPSAGVRRGQLVVVINGEAAHLRRPQAMALFDWRPEQSTS